MAKIDKHYLHFSSNKFNYKDKQGNINTNISYMLNRSNIMFKYYNLPKTIPSRELELQLQSNGFTIFTKIDGEYYVVNGGLGGEPNIYNNPTQATLSVPSMNYNKTLELDKECVLIKNDSIGMGLIPIYAKYSTLLNENLITMILTLVNKRNMTPFSASDERTVKSAERYIQKLYDGDLGVISENQLFDSLKVNTTNRDISLVDNIEFEQYMKASLYNEIGLSANYNMKKERLTKEEFTTNSDNLYPLVDDMLNNRIESIQKINELYGLDIQVELNSSWGGRDGENKDLDIKVGEDGNDFENINNEEQKEDDKIGTEFNQTSEEFEESKEVQEDDKTLDNQDDTDQSEHIKTDDTTDGEKEKELDNETKVDTTDDTTDDTKEDE